MWSQIVIHSERANQNAMTFGMRVAAGVPVLVEDDSIHAPHRSHNVVNQCCFIGLVDFNGVAVTYKVFGREILLGIHGFALCSLLGSVSLGSGAWKAKKKSVAFPFWYHMTRRQPGNNVHYATGCGVLSVR